MAAVKAILFDKDGTLIDFHRSWYRIAEELALEAAGGGEAEARALLERVGYDFVGRRFLPDSVFAAGTNADIVAQWYPDASRAERAERLATLEARLVGRAASEAVPIDGAEAALRRLRDEGYRLAVATNDSTASAERTLAALGMSQLFDAVFGYDAVANPKPAPDVVLAFADMAALRPAQIAMVGDNRHDMETGRAAGAGLTIGVLSGTGTRDSLAPLADAIVDSIADLPDHLAAGSG